jgi:eukaryotic-like serine/threonine-protein kinase
MDSVSWYRVKDIFQRAVELKPSDRKAFIERECGDDAEIKRFVLSMLDADRQSTRFLESPPHLPAPVGSGETDEYIGSRIADFTIIARIGEGGMGTVYRADQDDETFKRVAALKIVKRGMDSDAILRRFYTERRILAGLEHPNIARLIDGGMTDRGLPYFIMEYVDGKPITQYCDDKKAPLKERLQLFGKVCDAVRYAHNNLIVHRDLKPSNILVKNDGTVKLLDFGIAKLLIPGETADFATWSAGIPVLTPEYASPEQIRGESITMASDVYSLGVLLYELLTGRRPYEFNTRNPVEIDRTTTTGDVERPSKRYTRTGDDPETVRRISIARSATPDQLRRDLSGDLDSIVLNALQRNVANRYWTVDQLADDLERYRRNLPISVRKETILYRTGKFIRRNTVSVSAALLVILALIGGLLASLYYGHIAEIERSKAQERFDEVRSLANFFIFDVHDEISDLPGSTDARALIVERGLDYLDRLSVDARNDPELLREIALGYQRIGDVQGNPTNANLGDTDAARRSYMRSIGIAERLVHLYPDNDHYRRTLALIYEKMSDLEAWSGNPQGAAVRGKQALQLFIASAHDDPTNVQKQRSMAISRIKLGDLLGNPAYPNTGNTRAALDQYKKASLILQTLSNEDPDDWRSFRYLALSFERIGTMHEIHAELDDAFDAYRRSYGMRQRFIARNPHHTDGIRDVAIANEKLGGVYLKREEYRDAAEYFTNAFEIYDRLAQMDPQNRQAHLSLAIILVKMGELSGLMNESRPGMDSSVHFIRAESLLGELIDAGESNQIIDELLARISASSQ